MEYRISPPPEQDFEKNILKNLNVDSYNVCIFTMFYKS